MSADPSPPPPPAPPLGAVDPELPPAPPLEPSEVMYKTRAVDFLGRRTHIIYQNDNGPCPLLAICNVLLLKNVIKFNPDEVEVSQQNLLNLVTEHLFESKDITQGEDEEYVRNWENNISEAITLLPRLTTGIDVNVMFRKVDDFEFTPQRAIFDLLDIPLYHGWIVDPQDTGTATAIGSKSYNALASGLAEFKSGKPAEEDKHVAEEETIDFAAATTAALGVPSPTVSIGRSFDESTLPDSAEMQIRRGDREEDEELRRALSLSKAESANAVDGSVPFSTSQSHPSSNIGDTPPTESFGLEAPEIVGPTNKEEASDACTHGSILQDTNSDANVSEVAPAESERTSTPKETNEDDKTDMSATDLDIPVQSSESTLACPSHESSVLDDQAAAPAPDLGVADKETCREHSDMQVHDPQASDAEISCDLATVTSQATPSCATPKLDQKIVSLDTAELASSSIQENEPIYQGEEHILGSGNIAYQTEEPVYESEVVLAEQADKTGESSQCLENVAADHQWDLIYNFLQTTANQLTVYGLSRLKKDLNKREICVLFRNNHFNTMLNYNESLYLLVTDQGFFSESDVVWQKLDDVNGDGGFLTSNFTPFKSGTPRNDSWNQQQAMTTNADYLAQFANSILPNSSGELLPSPIPPTPRRDGVEHRRPIYRIKEHRPPTAPVQCGAEISVEAYRAQIRWWQDTEDWLHYLLRAIDKSLGKKSKYLTTCSEIVPVGIVQWDVEQLNKVRCNLSPTFYGPPSLPSTPIPSGEELKAVQGFEESHRTYMMKHMGHLIYLKEVIQTLIRQSGLKIEGLIYELKKWQEFPNSGTAPTVQSGGTHHSHYDDSKDKQENTNEDTEVMSTKFAKLSNEKHGKFEDMGLKVRLLRGILESGFKEPSAIQQLAIVPICHGKNVILHGPSGVGKRLSFWCGVLERIDYTLVECQVLVLVKANEQAQHIRNAITGIGRYLGVKVYAATAGKFSSQRDDQKILASGVQVVVGTPCCILDLFQKSLLCPNQIKMVVFAKEDVLSSCDNMINEFLRCLPSSLQIGICTNTLSPKVCDFAVTFMNNPVLIDVKINHSLAGVQQYYLDVEKEEWKFSAFLEMCEHFGIMKERSIIYANTHENVRFLNTQLGFHPQLHITSNSNCVDLRGVSFVINYDIPAEPTEYLRRTGHIGQFGKRHVAINLTTLKQKKRLKRIQKILGVVIKELPESF